MRWRAALEIEDDEHQSRAGDNGDDGSRIEIFLGYFLNENDAAWVHDTAARMQYGDAALLNNRDSKDKKLNAKRKVGRSVDSR
jgi:hypothetical protein